MEEGTEAGPGKRQSVGPGRGRLTAGKSREVRTIRERRRSDRAEPAKRGRVTCEGGRAAMCGPPDQHRYERPTESGRPRFDGQRREGRRRPPGSPNPVRGPTHGPRDGPWALRLGPPRATGERTGAEQVRPNRRPSQRRWSMRRRRSLGRKRGGSEEAGSGEVIAEPESWSRRRRAWERAGCVPASVGSLGRKRNEPSWGG